MSETGKKFLRIVYYAAVSTALLTLAVLLMVACVNIYHSAPKAAFTPAAIAAQFDRIAIPVYLCLGLVAAGFILHPLLPESPESDKERDRMTVRRLRARTNLALCPAELADSLQKEQKQQRRHRNVAVGLFAVGSAVSAVWVWWLSRDPITDPAGFILRCLWVLGPCLLIAGGYGLFSLYFNRGSYRREIALYRQVPAEAKGSAPLSREEAWVAPLKNAVLMVAIGLIIAGLASGGAASVLSKAITICMECIGLG
ncbi:MAG: hypothetical protein E7527_05030 [Ruminococcaceae bacterium]|nr:hypothetical protein [Oscillospiraceae bacterium]